MDVDVASGNALTRGNGKEAPREPIETINAEDNLDTLEVSHDDNERSKSPELPRLPRAPAFPLGTNCHHDEHLPKPPQLPNAPAFPQGKKRNHDEYLVNSSDAPLFSSDDLFSTSADDYGVQRRKRQYQRSWFEPEDPLRLFKSRNPYVLKEGNDPLQAKAPTTRRPFTRGFDSGVWMGSDDSEEMEIGPVEEMRKCTKDNASLGSIDLEDTDLANDIVPSIQTTEDDRFKSLTHKAMQNIEDPDEIHGPVFPCWQRQPTNLKSFHSKQKTASQNVLEIVDRGCEDVDLS